MILRERRTLLEASKQFSPVGLGGLGMQLERSYGQEDSYAPCTVYADRFRLDLQVMEAIDVSH